MKIDKDTRAKMLAMEKAEKICCNAWNMHEVIKRILIMSEDTASLPTFNRDQLRRIASECRDILEEVDCP